MKTTTSLCLWLAAGLACSRPPAEPTPHDETPQPTNRIAVPESVRQNLGIGFQHVERRRVAATLRLPGHFELLPQARREHRTPMAGRVTIAVQPLQRVAPGDLLGTLDAPEWRRTQRELGEIATERRVVAARIASMQPLLAAHKAHEQSLREAERVMQERIQSLEDTRQSVGGQAQAISEAKVQMAQVRAQAAEAAEKHTLTEAALAELEANQEALQARTHLVLAGAAAMLGVEPSVLAGRWPSIDAVELRATAAGLVDGLQVASGGWVDAHALVLTVTDLDQVRFRARALQSDLPRLAPGLACTIHPASADATTGARLTGELQLGVEADPIQRTLDVFVQPSATAAFARPGVAAFLEIETAVAAEAELAIPLAAVMQDGLERVFFRRDPADPDRVIRVTADLGVDDGRWVEVRSGLVDGDEVVTAGAYALMLASSGSAPKGGHFHADGTWHEDH
ncbi:MAG: HlyD family efflux transporter periplasmic adaptor subunit [Planctomycetes bacterium]|nr:HlyD family efflux transporter periplasmic adaptor subunit [Planctomycetota bacterium]